MKNVVLFLISILIIHPLFGQDGKKTVKAEIDQLLNEQCASGTIPGAVAMVSLHGKIIHHAAYGYARKVDKDWKPL
ncbi:MAG: hypothetical protein ACKO3B_06160, partial [Bacteroidota bacterium]